ncbi:MAG: hypothetical protein UV78_C0072G0004 [Parcubacteria group bacterium GW2011_GWA2_43_17]|nr:MAG: hypothetical protein UV78_C0072G0004 [Parcubacteria group bacterium GW2011_GWA2_43_17]
MLEQDYSFPCPYCGETLSIPLDVTGGRRQAFVYDCEICCRPIAVEVEFKGNEVVSFSAEVEGE